MSKRSKLLGTYSSFKPQNKYKTRIAKIFKIVIVFFIAYQFLSVFILSTFIVKTTAMEPGILKDQRILTAPIISGASLNLINIKIPGIKEPYRGDVVLLKPGNADKLALYIKIIDPFIRFFTLQKISLDPNKDQNWHNQLAVKRIIGIPGDTIRMIDYKFIIKPEKSTGFIFEEILIEQEYLITKPEYISGMDPSFPFSGSITAL